MDKMPVIDVHTHLGLRGYRQVRCLADIAGYHWLVLELHRAGADVDEKESARDPEGFMKKAIPYFDRIKHTSNHYCMIGMLRDLYGFKGRTITAANWRALDKKIRAKAKDTSWLRTVADMAGIKHMTVAYSDGMPDKSDRYIPYEYGEYMFAAITRKAVDQIVGKGNPRPTSISVLEKAIEKRVKLLKSKHGVRALHIWIRDTWAYVPYDKAKMDKLLRAALAGKKLRVADEDQLISCTADITAAAAGKLDMTLQLFHGMWRYTEDYHQSACSFWNQDYMRAIPMFAKKHPETMMDIFLGTRIPSHEAASIARSYRNISVSGGWWHGFTANTLHTFFRDRLEMLPDTAWNAYFSDGYTIEWAYAKLRLTKNRLSLALAELVEDGLMTVGDALAIARKLLYDNAKRIYKL